MKRWLCILPALALTLGCLAGCGGAETAETAAPETELPAETETAAPEPTAAQAGPAPDYDAARSAFAPDTVVMTVDGMEIDWDMFFGAACEYFYNLYNYYGITDFSMELDDGVSFADMAKTYAHDALASGAMFHLKAAELGLSLDELQQEAIDEEYASYADLLAGAGISEAYYRSQMETSMYYRYEIPAYLYGEGYADFPAEDALAWGEDNGYLRAQHILFKTVDDNYDPLDDETVAAKRAEAESALERLRAADPSVRDDLFLTLMEECSEDQGGLASFPDGYTFTDGDMIPEFYAGTQALADGEISGLVEGYYGYHIIRRLPLEADLPTMEYDSFTYHYKPLRELAAGEVYENLLDDWYEALDIRYAGDFEDLDLASLFPAASEDTAAEEPVEN